MAMLAPSTPSDFGNEVDDLSEAYSPQQLQQKYAITKELKYLLALQKVTSAVQEAERSLTMSQQQMPGTVKNQLEQNLMERAESVAGLLGRGQQPQRQQPQRPTMMNRGGIIGYDEGGDVEQEADISWEEIASAMGEAGVEVVEDMKQNPLPYLAGLGLMLVPGGIAASGARGLAGLSSIANRAGLFKKLNQVFRKRTPREKKFDEVRESNQREAAGRAKLDEKPTPSRVDGRADFEVSPGGTAVPKDIRLGRESTRTDVGPYRGQPSGVPKGQEVGPVRTPRPDAVRTMAQAASGIDALMPETEPTQPASEELVDKTELKVFPEEGGTGDEGGNQGVADLLEPKPAKDYLKLAQEGALKTSDVLDPTVTADLQRRAGMTPEDLAGIRTAERENYLDNVVGRDRQLQAIREANEKQLETFQRQLAPEKIRRKNRLKAIAAGARGGTGLGQITANMIDAYYSSEEGAEELERLMAQTERDGKLKLIEVDIDLLAAADTSGMAMLDLSREDKKTALTDLANLAKGDLDSINAYATSLREGDDKEATRLLQKMQLLVNTYESQRRDERADRANAEAGLRDILIAREELEKTIRAGTTPFATKLREYEFRISDPEQSNPLSEEEKAEYKRLEAYIQGLVNQTMSEDVQALRDRYESILENTAKTKSPVSAADVLGVQ